MLEFADGRLITRVDGAVGWLTLNQPDRHNAVRLDMWRQLPLAVAALDADPTVRTIVLTGAGDSAFASGADIAEFESTRCDAATNRDFTRQVSAATNALAACQRPVIAMIRGYCIGGGMVLASACDIRISADDARFGVPAARLGLGYELDNFKRLQRIVGPGMAMEMLATARQLTAQEALACRLVNRVVTSDALLPTVLEMAAQIAELAPMTITAAKLASRADFEPQLDGAAQAAIDACFDSGDFVEGRAAFRQKRKPAFRGF